MNDWQSFTQAEDGISFNQLEQVIAGVLQELAFMFADPADEDDAVAPNEECIKATIAFKGPVSGDLGLIFPRSLCFELIANILGLEQEDISEPSDAEDALKELLNVVCG
ncbi:MAG: chemotaxis protein CheX, partial [Candidatus Latescibacteria bacterium]|nr:chemotaxis protein CheX [Candidatus Latescibacterota bacterium]